MPIDDGKLSNAIDVMGMAGGRVGGDARQRTARDPNGASAKVKGAPIPVLSATLPTEDAIWIFLRESEKGVIESRCAAAACKNVSRGSNVRAAAVPVFWQA